MGRRVLLGALAALAVAVLASAASGGEIVKADRGGDVKAVKGVSAAQISALEIQSVHVLGDPRIGFVVDVDMKGKPGAQFGKGKLADAGIGLVLGAPSGSSPAGIYSVGTGALGRTLTKTKSKEVGVLRDGDNVSFFLRGPGFENIESIRVVTFADSPFDIASTKPGYGRLSTDQIAKIIRGASLSDLELLTHGDLEGGGLDELDCDELERLRDVLDDQLDLMQAFENQFGSSAYTRQLKAALIHMGDDADEILAEECGPPPPPVRPVFAFDTWWYHSMPGVSYNCATVSTTPAWPGASGTATISGPGVFGASSKTFTLSAAGVATVYFSINSFGMYHYDFTASKDGTTVTGGADINVMSAQGPKTCPPP